MKKRVLSLFLALTLCLTLLPTAALATEDEMSAQSAEALLSTEGAAGTAEDPILIGSLSELEAFRYRVNEYRERTLCAQLTADITLGDNWTSIGNNLAYNGTFDGNGHTIKAENGVQNLFGRLGNAGKVQGLTVEIYTMTAPSGSGVIAQENQGTIERCSVRIYGTLTISGGFGLIANQNAGLIEHCRGAVSKFPPPTPRRARRASPIRIRSVRSKAAILPVHFPRRSTMPSRPVCTAGRSKTAIAEMTFFTLTKTGIWTKRAPAFTAQRCDPIPSTITATRSKMVR